MILDEDIIIKIHADFGENAQKALNLLTDEMKRHEHLNNQRVIRCIIYLAEKSFDKLIIYLIHAIEDPRDVIYWAEYEHQANSREVKYVRNFNAPFQT